MIIQVTSAATAVWISDAVCHIPNLRIDLPHGLSCSGKRVAKAEDSQLPMCRSRCLNNSSEKDANLSYL